MQFIDFEWGVQIYADLSFSDGYSHILLEEVVFLIAIFEYNFEIEVGYT